MLYSVWNHEWKIPKTNFTLKGHSRAAERTGFYIPQLCLFLDAGVQSPFSPEYIFITHTHTDHSFALPMLLTSISTRPKIFVTSSMTDLVDNFITAALKLTNGTNFLHDSTKNYQVCGVDPNQKFSFKTKNNFQINVRVFELDHSVPSVGYGFSFEKQKLKSCYDDLDKNEILSLKKNKVEITETVDQHFLAFILDTSIAAFAQIDIFNYNVIITECTFIKEEHMSCAKETKHINWFELLPYVKQHTNCTFVLCHFSLRYTNTELSDFFDQVQKEQCIHNIVVWLN